jgi:arylsulfatase A-like enzyme
VSDDLRESSAESEPAPLGQLLRTDAARAIAVAIAGCLGFAVVDYAATLLTYPSESSVGFGNALRLVILTLSLAAVLWLITAPLLAAAAVAARLGLAGVARQRAGRWPGLLAVGRRREGPSPAAAWLWALVIAGALYLAGSTLLTYDFTTRFKEPVLRAVLLAVLQLVLFAVAGGVGFATAIGIRAVGRWLQPRLGEANPFGRLVPAIGLLVLASLPGIEIFLSLVPQARELVPWRHLLSLVAYAGGLYAGVQLYARRGRLLPAARKPRRIALAAAIAGTTALCALSFFSVGGHPQTKYIAVTASPTMSRLIDIVRKANDFDGDGYGSLLGENDCGPLDDAIHPGARDIPDNGVDENCNGRDFSLSSLPTYRKGQPMPVPEEFRRDWNFLLITIDTVRYDHTTMGGYHRDTTPKLAELARRSANFTFANAPSAGTMASVPAILTSKFFHSGIALDENVKRGMPPRLKPSNTLVSEILEHAGYTNGAILSHEYFNDWGMEQGFDTYDNTLGKKHDPKSITSPGVTDRAVAWMAQHSGKKWFLWTHYLDPHGHYVSHPGETSYGDTELDRYNGELHFTDKHIGRLIAELRRMPDADRTIIIVTSDHGDGFKEHGFINHGQALYRELLHVPLIVHVPDLPPRNIPGPVSPLDIVPTIADLAGADTSGLSFEGESLVPQLFYGRDATERVVFAETNWPRPLRAAITNDYKLVYKLKSNVYELFDLNKDPWEKRNIANRDADALGQMRHYLDDWLERVYYSRDLESNQAAAKLTDTLLRDRPEPKHPTRGVSFDDGAIEVIGFDTRKDRFVPGDKFPLSVYFKAAERPSTDYRLQIEVWPEKDGTPLAPPMREARSKLRYTREGIFPTSRWRDGEFIRDRFGFNLPRSWTEGDTVVVGLRMKSREGQLDSPKGELRPGQPDLAIIGRLPLDRLPGRVEPAKPPQKPGKRGVQRGGRSAPVRP